MRNCSKLRCYVEVQECTNKSISVFISRNTDLGKNLALFSNELLLVRKHNTLPSVFCTVLFFRYNMKSTVSRDQLSMCKCIILKTQTWSSWTLGEMPTTHQAGTHARPFSSHGFWKLRKSDHFNVMQSTQSCITQYSTIKLRSYYIFKIYWILHPTS